MDKKVSLPIDLNPVARCYHNIAFPMSVIQGNCKIQNKDFMLWAVGKFLNVSFNEILPSNKYEICSVDNWGLDDQLFRHQCINVYSEIFQKTKCDLVQCIKTAIQENCYVLGQYNEKFIPDKSAYKKHDFVHDYLLYGYDDSTQSFLSIGYTLKKNLNCMRYHIRIT